MEDPHLLSGIQQNGLWAALPRKIVHIFSALIMIIILSVPYILFWPLLRLGGNWKSTTASWLAGNRSSTIKLARIELKTSGALATIAAALSLDRFALLFRVFSGQLSLIGSTPVSSDQAPENAPTGTLAYRPGVFSYAEAEEWPASGGDAAIVERFHLAHSSPLSDIGLVIKAFINRLQEKSTA